jgi:hypothetical protein
MLLFTTGICTADLADDFVVLVRRNEHPFFDTVFRELRSCGRCCAVLTAGGSHGAILCIPFSGCLAGGSIRQKRPHAIRLHFGIVCHQGCNLKHSGTVTRFQYTRLLQELAT